MATLIKIDGRETNVLPLDDFFGLSELYNLLNCTTIDIVSLSNGKLMVIDCEGKLKLDVLERVNPRATELYQQGRLTMKDHIDMMKRKHGKDFIVACPVDELADTIIGDVLICEPTEIR